MSFDRLRTADKWMSIVSALLLMAYLALVVYALASPSNDPQRGMAQGFLTFVVSYSYALVVCFGLGSRETTLGWCEPYSGLPSSLHSVRQLKRFSYCCIVPNNANIAAPRR
jgi:hypothetical protein